MVRLKPGDRVVVATHNAGKLTEMAELLEPYGLETISAGDLGLPEPEETGTTFEANAKLKARAAANASGLAALADDSGLAVDGLDGAPGIYSARWAGPDRDFMVAMEKIENRLNKSGARLPGDRSARFVATVCLALPAGDTEVFVGEVAGHLVWPPRGEGGFGYDPMFVPQGHDQTFAEMTRAEKRALSHRARAFQAMAETCLTRL
jgi:XTP/dITP diphosphohydrolase